MRFVIETLVTALAVFVLTLGACAIGSACTPADWQRGARFAVDLLDVACEFVELDKSDPEWAVYGCRAVDLAPGLLEGAPRAREAPPPPVLVRVHKRDRAAFERATAEAKRP